MGTDRTGDGPKGHRVGDTDGPKGHRQTRGHGWTQRAQTEPGMWMDPMGTEWGTQTDPKGTDRPRDGPGDVDGPKGHRQSRGWTQRAWTDLGTDPGTWMAPKGTEWGTQTDPKGTDRAGDGPGDMDGPNGHRQSRGWTRQCRRTQRAQTEPGTRMDPRRWMDPKGTHRAGDGPADTHRAGDGAEDADGPGDAPAPRPQPHEGP